MTGFDPSENEQDRRILYDVTRMRINKAEFDEETSEESESSGDSSEEEDQFAFKYKGPDIDDEGELQ